MTRAISNRKTKAASAEQASNVIVLPVAHHAGALAVQPMLFAGEDLPDMPPWLLEQQKPVQAKPKAKKAPAKKKAAAKKVKPVKAKVAPKKSTAAKRRKPIIKPAAVEIQPAADTQPLTRSMAPVVWRKNSPIAALRYWLRATGRNVIGLMAPVKPAGPRLRSRKELLVEIAVLRQENAEMRKKLNLPPMPFGRTVADSV